MPLAPTRAEASVEAVGPKKIVWVILLAAAAIGGSYIIWRAARKE